MMYSIFFTLRNATQRRKNKQKIPQHLQYLVEEIEKERPILWRGGLTLPYEKKTEEVLCPIVSCEFGGSEVFVLKFKVKVRPRMFIKERKR